MSASEGLKFVATESGHLVKNIPAAAIEALVHSLNSVDLADWSSSRARMISDIAHAYYRSLVTAFLDRWRSNAPEVLPQSVAAALLTAAYLEKASRESQSVELVWTGPEMNVVPLRRTEQAILQVIESALKRLTVVSYAVYNIPRICEALLRAADRGVAINVIIETPDKLEGKNTYDTLRSLGPSVATRCRVLLWPLDAREKDINGKPGILHVKCAVADGHSLFLSSANLTDYAFTINMELGLLVTGGKLPAQVERQFDMLIEARHLETV